MRVTRLGLGGAIQPQKYDVERATTLLGRMLSDEALLANIKQYAARIDFAAVLEQSCVEN